MTISGLTTFLWFDTEALDAAQFYVATFPGSSLGHVDYYPADAQRPAGSVLTVAFELFGQSFCALNGGPDFSHSAAVSFQVFCDTQEEIDRLWAALTRDGGAESRCGWCHDRWGVHWQVIPRQLGTLLGHADPEVSQRAFANMMTMGKIDIAGLSAPRDEI